SANRPRAALAGTLVIPRTQLGPTGQMRRILKPLQLGSNLGDQLLCQPCANSRQAVPNRLRLGPRQALLARLRSTLTRLSGRDCVTERIAWRLVISSAQRRRDRAIEGCHL